MSGLTPFSINSSEHFKASYDKLAKGKSSEYKMKIKNLISEIVTNPYLVGSTLEPRPSNMNLSDGWEFYKLKKKISKDAVGQIRVMYLVNKQLRTINFIWVYNHEQYPKRPHDKDISYASKGYFTK